MSYMALISHPLQAQTSSGASLISSMTLFMRTAILTLSPYLMTPLWLEFLFFLTTSFSIQSSNCFNLDDLKVDEFGEPFGTFGCFNLNGQSRGLSRALESLCSQKVCLWCMRCCYLGWLGG